MIEQQRIPLRLRRDLSEIIQAVLQLYGQNFGTLFLIASITIPVGIASSALQGVNTDSGLLFVNALSVLGLIASAVAAGALIAALVEIDEGREPTFSSAYEVAFDKVISIIGADLRVLFHVFLFAITIVGIPWAVQRLIRWLFVVQAVVVDDMKAKEALSTSASRVEGMWWRTLGMWLVSIVLLVGVPNMLIVVLYYAVAPGIVLGTGVAIVGALLLPFALTALTLIYFDLSVRKEAVATATPE